MQIKNSTKVLSHRTASVLHKKADSGTVYVSAHTTAWFCDQTNSWFDLMANRI